MKIMHDLRWWECFVVGLGYGLANAAFRDFAAWFVR